MFSFLTGSVVLAALVTALVALQNSERNIKLGHVTSERAKWRDRVRKKALQVHRAAVTDNTTRLAELHLEFTLILNPIDPDKEDEQILNTIRELDTERNKEAKLAEFADRVALLLKHDWERAKLEAEPFWKQPKPLQNLFKRLPSVKRKSYDEFEQTKAKRP